jgi:NAD(P)-dependent dehydrogenase (short-subunit alcohol dehydrogenase family)
MNSLKGKKVLITGASRGLGAALANAFWAEGAHLILVGRSAEKMKDLVASLGSRPDQKILAVRVDLKRPESPAQILAETKNTFEGLDVLINNAGMQGPIGPCWENDWEAWKETLQVDLLAPVALCRLFIPWMANQGRGKIINLSGGGAAGPRACFTAYATAKTGLVRCSEILAAETKSLGIDINCVAPGAMATSLLTDIMEAGPQRAGPREYEQAQRVLQSDEDQRQRAVALCVFLASTASDGITGKLISAVWDPWVSLPDHLGDLEKTDIYTLRRVVPPDRGLGWGE